MNTFTVPGKDLAEFHALSAANRDAVRCWLVCLEGVKVFIDKRPSVLQACRRAAFLGIGVRGFSAASIRRKYYDYTRTGDWRVLIPRYLALNNPQINPLKTHIN